ncbi:hypothetical protein BH11PLA1_BH11PLA1_14420 [soil metagenome]
MLVAAHPENVRLLAQPHRLAAERFHLLARKLADELTYGTDPSRFTGPGVDYAQTRMMQLGDAVRSIDWRVTARTGRLHVKDYEASKRLGVYLLVDTSASMAASSTEVSKHDVAVWCAAVLAQLALNRRSPVCVISCAERDLPAAPSSTRAQVTAWIEALRRRSFVERTRLADAVRRVETLAKHRAMVVVISDLHDPEAAGAIARLGQRHDVIVIQPRDPAEGGELGAGFVRGGEAETGALFLATAGQRFGGRGGAGSASGATLVGAGLDHVVLRTDMPVMPALRRVLNAKRGPQRSAR